MRSRYTAFALGDADYLRDSWHADHRPGELGLDSRVRWLGLEILSFTETGKHAQVEFEARYLADGRVDAIHEHSDFVLDGGRWFYTRGEQLAARFTPWKPSRNEACPCGSGRKFKRCCGTG